MLYCVTAFFVAMLINALLSSIEVRYAQLRRMVLATYLLLVVGADTAAVPLASCSLC